MTDWVIEASRVLGVAQVSSISVSTCGSSGSPIYERSKICFMNGNTNYVGPHTFFVAMVCFAPQRIPRRVCGNLLKLQHSNLAEKRVRLKCF